MRLGMSGAFLPNNMDDFTPDQAARYMKLVTKLSEAAASMY